jgi:hypothetical protein
MKEIVYRCDQCKEVLERNAIGIWNTPAGITSKILNSRNYTDPDELLCNWSCHMNRMDIKYPINGENNVQKD